MLKKLNRFLGEILGCSDLDVYERLDDILGKIISRKRLQEYGMKEEEIEIFAQSVQESQQRLLNQSYVKMTAPQMAQIYRQLY